MEDKEGRHRYTSDMNVENWHLNCMAWLLYRQPPQNEFVGEKVSASGQQNSLKAYLWLCHRPPWQPGSNEVQIQQISNLFHQAFFTPANLLHPLKGRLSSDKGKWHFLQTFIHRTYKFLKHVFWATNFRGKKFSLSYIFSDSLWNQFSLQNSTI